MMQVCGSWESSGAASWVSLCWQPSGSTGGHGDSIVCVGALDVVQRATLGPMMLMEMVESMPGHQMSRR